MKKLSILVITFTLALVNMPLSFAGDPDPIIFDSETDEAGGNELEDCINQCSTAYANCLEQEADNFKSTVKFLKNMNNDNSKVSDEAYAITMAIQMNFDDVEACKSSFDSCVSACGSSSK